MIVFILNLRPDPFVSYLPCVRHKWHFGRDGCVISLRRLSLLWMAVGVCMSSLDTEVTWRYCSDDDDDDKMRDWRVIWLLYKPRNMLL